MELFAEAAPATNTAALGVMIFVLGGLAGAVFYLPFKRVKNWAWESYWMIYAVAGLVIVPWTLAFATSPNLCSVLAHADPKTLASCFACGALWGVGGLTWGLMIRYLGVGLGLAIGCGLCSAAGTLIPPVINSEFGMLIWTAAGDLNWAGIVSLAGVAVSLVGIVLVGMAGMSKERELPEEVKKIAVAEYNFKLGIIVAVFSGLTSAGMNFGLQGYPGSQFKAEYGSQTQFVKMEKAKKLAGERAPAEIANAEGLFYDENTEYWIAPKANPNERTTPATWRGMPILVVVLAGGFMINFLWCLFLNLKNKTVGDYTKAGAPILGNLVFAGLAGAIWCSQFICLKTGEPAMGKTAYIGFAVLMASAILFSTLLGILLGEWKNTSGRTKGFLAAGLAMLIASAVISGCSGYLKEAPSAKATAAVGTFDPGPLPSA